MCGICGIIKPRGKSITRNEFYYFLNILIISETRGSDSAGVFYVKNDGETVVMKSEGGSSIISGIIPYLQDVCAIVGHTRLGTGGTASNNLNNHPHENEDFVLVHNGVVNTIYTDAELGCKGLCDTEELIQSFSFEKRKNPEKTDAENIAEAFGHIYGSWSLCFYNKNLKELYLTTNGSSPLDVITKKDKSTIIFASEFEFFKFAEIPEKEWDELDIADNVLYKVNEDLDLEFLTKYEENHYSCTYGNSYNWRGTSKSKRSGAMFDYNNYFGEDVSWYNNNNRYHESSKYVSVMKWILENGIEFDLETKEATDLVNIYTNQELKEEAINSLIEGRFALNLKKGQVSYLEVNRRKGVYKVSRKIKSKIESLFLEIFEYSYKEYLESIRESGYSEYIYDIMDSNFRIEKSLLEATPWYVKTLICSYGVVFVGGEGNNGNKIEVEQFKLSSGILCSSCRSTYYSVKKYNDGTEVYTCPECSYNFSVCESNV